MGAMEEQVCGEEDMRGTEAFIAWCVGPAALEIRRIAGLVSEVGTTTATGVEVGGKEGEVEERPEDFLTKLKKKHAKTRDGEESRWAGTVLGREREREGGIRIEGWEGVEGMGEWAGRLGKKEEGRVGRSGSSSPLSEISAGTAV